MSHSITSLQPEKVWRYFENICRTPRPSKKEEKILKHLIDFAKAQNLSYLQDACGNILISKAATAGCEKATPVVLQCHVDMVCEKNADIVFDFLRDPIVPKVENGWVTATGTTLGADNGIGMAVMMAILEDPDIVHGPLECLFTIDEETGLTGAFGLEPDFLKGRILLNLDSADEGELCIGCAGGIDTEAIFEFSPKVPEKNQSAFELKISGLQGGHSGDDINRGRGNAIKILARLLWNMERQFPLSIATINGGNLRNAIAREARAVFLIAEQEVNEMLEFCRKLAGAIRDEIARNEPDCNIEIVETQMPDSCMDASFQRLLLNILYASPHGVITMSPNIEGLVETSTNLASVKTLENTVKVATSQRSALESGKNLASQMVRSSFELGGAQIKHGDGYPGWKPNVQSPILQICSNVYKKMFGTEPKVLAIHAGLECGVIGGKYPGMDMISFGPTIKGAHSPDERVEIASVQKFWDFTLGILKSISK